MHSLFVETEYTDDKINDEQVKEHTLVIELK